MVSNRNRIKSIRTPERRDRISPSKRQPREEDGPTPFTLQRHAEQIGAGTVCDLSNRKVGLALSRGTGHMTTNVMGAKVQADADFAASSSLHRLQFEDAITTDQWRAGTIYARLNRLLFGRGVPKPSALGKVMASSMEDRIAAANRASREERDDDEYAEWLGDQKVIYARGEHALAHVAVPMTGGWAKIPERLRRAKLLTIRMQVRAVCRRVCLDDVYPRRTMLPHLKLGLQVLADTWEVGR